MRALSPLAILVAISLGFSAEQNMATTYSLEFDSSSYQDKEQTIDGITIAYRAFEDIVYVANPANPDRQKLNIFVPLSYYDNTKSGKFDLHSAPIFLPNDVGGYMPAAAGEPGPGWNSPMNAAFYALSEGYVVAYPGVRGRTEENGKAPAAIVDLKAAVRYLRYNDKTIPGDSEKVISNGTSAGGALSALLAATGNNSDYSAFLDELGAAPARDDIYAASAYCPITNLDNSDTAYEWLFNGYNEFEHMRFTRSADGSRVGEKVSSTLDDSQIDLSNELAALFPAYLNSLHLEDGHGNALTLEADGTGSFADHVKQYVIDSAQTALSDGVSLDKIKWIELQDGKVADIDFPAYVAYATRKKTPPAFDSTKLDTPENQLFGNKQNEYQHFTRFSLSHGTEGSSLAAADRIKLMNPMNYIGTETSDTAPFWRIRHGAIDRDTSLAIPVILATRLRNTGYEVDFTLPWDVPHSGDYDLPQLFNWIEKVTGANEASASKPLFEKQFSLNLEATQMLISAAQSKAEQMGAKISAAVVDRSGNLIAFERMDGASLVTIEVAIGKANTAAQLGAPSSLFENMINEGQTAMLTVPGIVPLQGGIPIYHQGSLAGAIGISGSSGENDNLIASEAASFFAE